MPILVSLLVVVGLGTAGLFGYIGLVSVANQPTEISSASSSQAQEPKQDYKALTNMPVQEQQGESISIENQPTSGDQTKNNPPQTDTPLAPSTQTPNSNSGASANKADPPKSGGTTPANQNSGTNSDSTATIKPNQPKTNTSNNNSNSGRGSGNGNNFNTYNNQDQQQTTDQWVLNTSTKKIHYKNCRDVPKIAPENYSTSNSPESELISQGYTTCGHCH